MLSKKTNTLQIKSETEFNSYFKEVKQELSETESEHNWSKFTKRFEELSQICFGCHSYPSFLDGIRKVRDCLYNSLLTERTTLSLKTMDFVTNLAKTTQKNFSPYLELVMSPLLKITGKTNKVFVRKAVSALKSIIVDTKLPVILPHIAPNLTSKNKQQRVYACELVLNCMNSIPPKELENYLNIFINAVKNGVVDADSEVRTASKKIFEKFKKSYPESTQDLISVLCDTAKKNLKISGGATSSISSLSRPKISANPRATLNGPSRPISQPISRTRPTQPRVSPPTTTTVRPRPVANPISRLASRSVSGNTRISPNTAARKPSTISNRTNLATSFRSATSPTKPSIKRSTVPSHASSTNQTSKLTGLRNSSSIPTSTNHTTSSRTAASLTRSSIKRSSIPSHTSSIDQATKLIRSNNSTAIPARSTGSGSTTASILAKSRSILSAARSSIKRPRDTVNTSSISQSSGLLGSNQLSTAPIRTGTSVESKPAKNYFKYDRAHEVMAQSSAEIIKSSNSLSQSSLSKKFKAETAAYIPFTKPVSNISEPSSKPVVSTLLEKSVASTLEPSSKPVVSTLLEKSVASTLEPSSKSTLSTSLEKPVVGASESSSGAISTFSDNTSQPISRTPRTSYPGDFEISPYSILNTLSPRMSRGSTPSSPINKRVINLPGIQDEKIGNSTLSSVNQSEPST